MWSFLEVGFFFSLSLSLVISETLLITFDGLQKTEVGLSLKSNQCLQLTPKDATSKIQICYRINQREIEDQAYLFHEAHRNLSRNAERVLKIVDWWNKKGYSR